MLRRLSVLAVLFVAAIPLTARAQLFPFGPCGLCHRPWSACGCPRPICGGCQLPPAGCQCGAPAPMLPPPALGCAIPKPLFETVVRPVVETTFCPEQFTTCVPVTRTHVRQEACTVNVPVTVHKQVTVDEGCFQMVWVPKPVTRTVPETAITQQVQYRSVPFQVVEQVPTVQTRMVPRQTVRYIQETRPVGCAHPAGVPFPMTPAPAMVPGVVPPVTPAPMIPGGTPHFHAPTVPPSGTTESPPPLSVPDPYLQPGPGNSETRRETNWVKIPQRQETQAKEVELQSYQQMVPSVPRGMFSPAPSAAAVWRAQSSF